MPEEPQIVTDALDDSDFIHVGPFRPKEVAPPSVPPSSSSNLPLHERKAVYIPSARKSTPIKVNYPPFPPYNPPIPVPNRTKQNYVQQGMGDMEFFVWGLVIIGLLVLIINLIAKS